MEQRDLTVNELIFGRRTLRQYSSSPVPDDILQKIIEAGLYAPSACNFQAWKIIILSGEGKNEFVKLYGEESRGARPIINNCRQGILMTYRNDLYVTGRKYKDYIQSAAAAIQNMILMAGSYGVGCCWICDLPDEMKIKKFLNIPRNYDVVAFVSMGFPSGEEYSPSESRIYHYGSEENYRLHKRKYRYDQVVSKNSFERVEGDSGYAKYPPQINRSVLIRKFPRLYEIYTRLKKKYKSRQTG